MKIHITTFIGIFFLTPFFAAGAIDSSTISFSDQKISEDHIRLLQTILNDDPRTMIASRGWGAPGNETGHFGLKTRDALKRFQEIHREQVLSPIGLSSGTGNLGIRTRLALEEIHTKRLSISIVSLPIVNLASHEHHPSEGDGSHAKWFNSPELLIVPEDMWVTSIVPEVRGADNAVLHHAMVFRVGEPNAVCPNIEVSARELFAVSSNSVNEPVGFPSPYGLHLKKGDQLLMEVMVHNPLPPFGPGKFITKAEIAIRLSGTTATTGRERTPVEFARVKLDDSPCQLPLAYIAFKVPPQTPEFVKNDMFFGKNGSTTPSGTFIMPHDATIIGLGANIWPMKGGRSMRMLVNAERRAEISAVLTDKTTPWSWSLPLISDKPTQVKKGDLISAEAVYVNPNPYVIPDASGMLGFYYTTATTTTGM